jgi:hypothetical protein
MQDKFGEVRAFPYSVARSWTRDIIPAFAVAAVLLGLDMLRGRGIQLDGRYHSPDDVAGMFRIGLLFLSVAGAIRLFSIWRRSGDPKAVEVRADSVFLPRAGIRRGFFTVYFQDIRRVIVSEDERDPAGIGKLTIDSAHGEARLLSSGFESMKSFNEFAYLLKSRWKAAKHTAPNPAKSPVRG